MGGKSVAFGSLFEEIFFHGCSSVKGMAITRFPDGCRVVGRNKIIRVKTPFDWVVTYGGVTALLDTKTSEENFPFSHIEHHQVNEMLRHSQWGAKAGYVIWMRKTDDIIFCSALMLSGLMSRRGSIQPPQSGGSNYLGKSGLFRPKMIFGVQ